MNTGNLRYLDTSDFNNTTIICGQYNNITCVFGSCNSTLQCECSDDYATLTPDESEECNYKRKKVKIAFLLEFFLPIGAGHYYLNKLDFACFKTFFFAISVLSIVAFYRAKTNKYTPDTTKLILALNMLMFVPLLITWQILDLFLFGFRLYLDSNDIEMADW